MTVEEKLGLLRAFLELYDDIRARASSGRAVDLNTSVLLARLADEVLRVVRVS